MRRRGSPAGQADGGHDAGSAALELVVLAPALLLLFSLVIFAGRTTIVRNSMAAAARDAARQASISLTASGAQAAAHSSADAALSRDGLHCTPQVMVDTRGFAVPPGQPAQVSARVTCKVPISDLLLPGMPGSWTVSASFTSPLDPYRER